MLRNHMLSHAERALHVARAKPPPATNAIQRTVLDAIRTLSSAPHWAAASLVLSAACSDVAAPDVNADAAQRGLLMQLGDGPVHGTLEYDTRSFIGVPYAAPPTGELRWKPPQPVASWHDALEATGPGVACPQPEQPNAIAVAQSEDCLYLNVFAPAEPPAALLPVMVWLHGGGNTIGSANLTITSDPILGYVPPPRRLADGTGFREYTERQVVVVTVNYRLGALGFLSHPGLTSEGEGASGNYGIMDQQAALSWVQRNISSFGGDPARVTLFGQGAGATDACYHLVADGSRGLFQAAVLQSGSCGSQQELQLAQAEEQGASLANELGCTESDHKTAVQCLRAMPASAFVQGVPSEEIIRRELHAQLVVDGRVLAQGAGAAFATGDFAHVPLIIGNDDRCARRECSRSEATRNEQLFVCPARELARHASKGAPVFLYSFTRSASYGPSPEEWANIASGSEQLWVWNIWSRLSPYAADDGSLSLQMRGYWNQLIEGDVNVAASEQRWARPNWAAYDADHETELLLDINLRTTENHRSARCD